MTTLTVNNRKTYYFKKIYDILVFLDFLYLLQTLQHILTYLDSIENILILFYHSYFIHEEEINLYTLLKFKFIT